MMRSAKVDANQPAIVTALRKAGAMVRATHAAGDGFPDLVVAFRGAWHLLECKSDAAAVNRKSMTAVRQAEFRGQASVHGCIVPVVTTPEEALRAVGALG